MAVGIAVAVQEVAVDIEAGSIEMVVVVAAGSMAVGVTQTVKDLRTVLEGFDIAAERTAAAVAVIDTVAFH
jgi:hypothetical protein